MIKDYNELNKFLNILQPLKRDEVYFFSLSTRKKYLSIEERETYDLGRTEMWSRQLVRDKDQIENTLRKMEAILNVRLTKTNLQMPVNATVCYVNINPSSTIKAYQSFIRDMNKAQDNIMNSLLSNGNPDFKAFQYLDRKLHNCIQKHSGSKYWLDIDIDTDDYNHVLELTDSLNDIEHHVIETRGGYHVLVNREMLNLSKIKLHLIVNKIDEKCDEAIFNKNAMIPVPGTMQNNHLVRVL